MKRIIIVSQLFLWSLLCVTAQELWPLHRFDETNSELQGHATMMLQDLDGLLWISTWSGLYRFDGYEFQKLKPQAGDGCSMATDRLRDIWLSDDGDIYCRAEEEVYRFDTKTYRFCDLRDDAERTQAEQQRRQQTTRAHFIDGVIDYIDPQGLEWQLTDDALLCFSRTPQPVQPLDITPAATVRCISQDSKGRIWIATKDDAVVRLYDQQLHLLGYLSPSGRIQPQYVSFGAPVYSFAQTPDGSIWLGAKPNGLYRLRETSNAVFSVGFIDDFGRFGIYDIKADLHSETLWIATLGQGVSCVKNYRSDHPLVIDHVGNYPADVCQRVRYIHLVAGTSAPNGKTGPTYLLATTTEGLMVGRVGDEPQLCEFRRHVKDPRRPSSLSCNATMNVAEDPQGRIFVSTETDGICQLLSTNLWADTLSFLNYDVRSGHLPTDMTVAMSLQADGRLLIVSQTQFMLFDTYRRLCESFGHRFFHQSHRFSEVRPLQLADGRWLFATSAGAFTLRSALARSASYQPPLVLTGVSVQGRQQDFSVNKLDTLVLAPSERSVTVHFAALDYTDPQAVRYQFRMGQDTATWINLGHEHAVTLTDLKPGTYTLALRSTNADGQWTQNVRMLTIIRRPTFWETPWATLLLVLLAIAVVGGAAYTYLYIRRIQRQRQEALGKYLALLKLSEDAEQPAPAADPVPTGNSGESANADVTDISDPFMQKVLTFVEQNIGNSDADVTMMAEACAMSRSVLQRRMKSLLGVSPADFLREARMKRAAQLLRYSNKTVSEVAFAVGFNDPKYFGRTFRQYVGQSPSDYKSAAGKSEKHNCCKNAP